MQSVENEYEINGCATKSSFASVGVVDEATSMEHTSEEKAEVSAEVLAKMFKIEEVVIHEKPRTYIDEILDIKNQIEGDSGEQLGNPAFYKDFEENAEDDLDDENIPIGHRLQQAAIRVNQFHSLQVHSLQVLMGTYTRYAIETGKVLLKMQSLCERAISIKQIANPSWAHWAVRNLAIPKTTRDKYMRLARNPDAQDFSYLGTELLLELISQTEEWAEKTPKAEGENGNEIGRFLLANGVFFTSYLENNVAGQLITSHFRSLHNRPVIV